MAALFLLLLSAPLFHCGSVGGPLKLEPLMLEEQLLWVNGQDFVSSYRIPLLTFTPKGSLLAFAEGRKMSRSDYGSKFIAMRRSTDKGATWSPMSFIADDDRSEQDGLNLGSVVVDMDVRRVILIYTMCFHLRGCSTSSTMMVESKDDGLSWGSPKNLSAQIGVKNFAPGPGTGIQKRHDPNKGRLVVCGHGTIEGDGVFCILSDDHGKTWSNGAALKSIPYNQKKRQQDFSPDECQPVEMPDGSIIVNVRNQNNYHCRCRVVARSRDGGMTLPIEDVFFDYELVDPVVAAGVLQKEGVMYFINPSNEYKRVNLTLRWSLTDGNSWENNTVQIWAGPSGYSCMTSLDNSVIEDKKYIYIIYEKGHKDSNEAISFVKIHLFGGR
nr:PREDICTED: sialidase-1 [Paralichthys olivaceus]